MDFVIFHQRNPVFHILRIIAVDLLNVNGRKMGRLEVADPLLTFQELVRMGDARGPVVRESEFNSEAHGFDPLKGGQAR